MLFCNQLFVLFNTVELALEIAAFFAVVIGADTGDCIFCLWVVQHNHACFFVVAVVIGAGIGDCIMFMARPTHNRACMFFMDTIELALELALEIAFVVAVVIGADAGYCIIV